jgi:hypothetical protein
MGDMWRLEKKVGDEWCLWGEYDDIDALARAAFELGRNCECVDQVRVVLQTQEGDKEW